MRQVRFNLTTLEDMNAYSLFDRLEDLFGVFRNLISEGYIIVLYRDFTNAPPEIVEQIQTELELNNFIPRFIPA